MNMRVGSLVTSNTRRELVCGSGRYDFAVVASMEPFILISQCGDMKWSTWSPEELRVCGYASDETMAVVNRRLELGY